ncbi:amino acid adenylation domain-containing protein [Pasteurella multocida]|uniref:amino acid adenylation domain-containing protein n=1 Tax=Pasteurella multocida TaxID=747 RepID=UPI00397C3709
MGSEIMKEKRICFIFPGQGNQWPGMCDDLLENNDTFRKQMAECDEIYRHIAGLSVLELLESARGSTEVYDDITRIQPVLFCIQYSLARMWQSLGVRADAVIGHSLGEITAACYGGYLSLSDALRIVYARVEKIKTIASQSDGGMMAINLPLEQVADLIAPYENLYISVYNSQQSHVVSGKKQSLDALAQVLESNNIFHKILAVNHASHSPYVAEIRDALINDLRSIVPGKGCRTYYSTRYGYAIEGNQLTPEYWAESEMFPVLFSATLAESLADDYTDYIEISPHPTLLKYVEAVSGRSDVRLIPTLIRNQRFNADLQAIYGLEDKPGVKNICWQSDNSDRKTLEVRQVLTDIIVGSALRLPQVILAENTLQENGIDSLTILSVKNKIESHFNIRVAMKDIFTGSLENILSLVIETIRVEASPESNIRLPATEYKKLTDIQQAYILGESDTFPDGNAIAHIYAEQNFSELNVNNYLQAWSKVIGKHEALRTCYRDSVPYVCQDFAIDQVVTFIDLEGMKNIRQRLREDREKFKSLRLSREEPVRLRVFITKVTSRRYKVAVFIDLIAVDAISLNIIFRDLSFYYANPHKVSRADNTWQNYLDYFNQKKTASSWHLSKAWWKGRELPPPPALPLIHGGTWQNTAFVRKKLTIAAADYAKLKQSARDVGISPAVMLAAVYSYTLSLWSKINRFSLCFMLSERPLEDNRFRETVGNFSTTLIIEVDCTKAIHFADFSRRLQDDLWEKLEYAAISGVEALQLAMIPGTGNQPAIPFVFASGLDTVINAQETTFGPFHWYGKTTSYSYLETPQVWLDNQVFEDHENNLIVHWDYRRDKFYPGLMDEMFHAYSKLLIELLAGAKNWHQILTPPPSNAFRTVLSAMRDTACETADELLTQGLLNHAQATPDNVALRCGADKITYQRLLSYSLQIKETLDATGCSSTKPVAVYMEKSWQQIAAVLAVQLNHQPYLPLAVGQPLARVQTIIDTAQCELMLVSKDTYSTMQDNFPALKIVVVDELTQSLCSNKPPVLLPAPGDSELSAYVIFTSGSTGIPKGVEVSHRAAVNTCLDINRKFSLTSRDVVYGVSALSFDLSVYDIFGTFFAGATLCLPDGSSSNDPALWYQDVLNNQVTIWNSSPALFQMLLEYIRRENLTIPACLRLVMLSGDWIPLSLVRHVLDSQHPLQLVSLGGATEAAIWSVYYPINTLQDHWQSIPYGKALANQQLYVLDEKLHDCLPLIQGDIFIGGEGLAKGYFNNEEKTQLSFIRHPVSGERLYKTGDKGRYCQDGLIEFLGREDNQVKIRGYRIELGDIESALESCRGIIRAVVNTTGNDFADKTIAAWVTVEPTAELADVRRQLAEKLPEYMQPSAWYLMEQVALTANGKVDRKSLTTAHPWRSSEPVSTDISGPTARILADIWQEILGIEDPATDLHFFELGGNSFNALRVLSEIKQRIGIKIELGTFYQLASISQVSRFIDANQLPQNNVMVVKEGRPYSACVFIYPIGGSGLCYSELIGLLHTDDTIILTEADYDRDYSTSGHTLADIAEDLAATLLSEYSFQHINVVGWSMGGVIGQHMAGYLHSQGLSVSLTMLDSPLPGYLQSLTENELKAWFIRDLGLDSLSEAQLEWTPLLLNRFQIFKFNQRILSLHHPQPASFPVFYVTAEKKDQPHYFPVSDYVRKFWGWDDFLSNIVKELSVNCDHYSLMSDMNIGLLAKEINAFLATQSLQEKINVKG